MAEQRSDRRNEVLRRLGQVRTLLEGDGLDGAVLHLRRNFAWVTAGGANHVVLATEEGAAPLLITRDEAIVLAPVNEARRIDEEELDGVPIEVVPTAWHDVSDVHRQIRDRVSGRLLDDLESDDRLLGLRIQLSPFDHRRLRELASDVQEVVASAVESLRPGQSEASAAARLIGGLFERQATAPVVLAAADERIDRYRHPLPTDRRVERRMMLIVVAERWGLHAAATVVKDFVPAPAEIRRRTAAVESILAAMQRASRSGATLGDVLHVTQEAYRSEGFGDEWSRHHQGGLIGYRPREVIAIPGDHTPLKPGMAVAWNPSVAGAKAEGMSIVAADGPPDPVG